jgi:hypothetical protein
VLGVDLLPLDADPPPRLFEIRYVCHGFRTFSASLTWFSDMCLPRWSPVSGGRTMVTSTPLPLGPPATSNDPVCLIRCPPRTGPRR